MVTSPKPAEHSEVAKRTRSSMDRLPSGCPAMLEITGLYELRLAREVDKEPKRHGSRNRKVQDISSYRLSAGSDIWATSSLGVPGRVG